MRTVWVRALVVPVVIISLAGLGWAITVKQVTSGWAWPLWLVLFLGVTLLASATTGKSRS